MRGLLRSALGLVTLGSAMIGCRQSDAPQPPADRPDEGPGSARPEVTFYVPGMT